jgi:superfamily II DNA helicase RecQ
MHPPNAPTVRVKLLTLAFQPSLGAIDARALDDFLADKELLDLREHFFVVQGLPHLLCVLTYRLPRGTDAASANERPAASGIGERPRRERIDLDEPARARFETLRAWRADRARRDGVPPYVLFHNRELAAIASRCPATPNALLQIDGIGEGKVERYGDEVLAALGRAPAPEAAP